jgi:hypothetical protein
MRPTHDLVMVVLNVFSDHGAPVCITQPLAPIRAGRSGCACVARRAEEVGMMSVVAIDEPR